jgi:hypothetical protein
MRVTVPLSSSRAATENGEGTAGNWAIKVSRASWSSTLRLVTERPSRIDGSFKPGQLQEKLFELLIDAKDVIKNLFSMI